MKPTDEQLDYPDCGDPTRETGIELSPRLRKMVDEAKAKRTASKKPLPVAAE